MTIAAFRALLDEIDTQGGPEAARRNLLHLPNEGTQAMNTAPAHTGQPPTPLVSLRPADTAGSETLPVGKLLAWGDQHDDPDIQAQAGRARAALAGLRQRYAADQELTALTSEEEQLAQRLEAIRARKGELEPAKPKKRKTPRDYDAAMVRAWAREHGVDCPERGRVPKAVVDAWKQATGLAA